MTVQSQLQPHVSGFEDTSSIYHEQLSKTVEPIFLEFDAINKRFILFNLFFLSLCLLEIILLLFFFTLLAESFMMAISLATVFFTFFAYFTLRIYFQTKKPEQLILLKEEYLNTCKSLLNYQDSLGDHHMALANACCKLANRLHGREYNYYRPPRLFSSFASLMERLSCWLHWQEVHFMKEQLLEEAINEHIKRVKLQPTSLEAHAALANAYVMLSGIYIDPRKMEGYDDERWISDKKYSESFNIKFRWVAERAIEEFKILSEYAPDDPWVHCQLAYSYHDLQMPLEEITEYETIQRLLPDDRDNLYKLGMLYFQQGMNAKGLRVYEVLRKSNYQRSEILIKYYGSYSEGILKS